MRTKLKVITIALACFALGVTAWYVLHDNNVGICHRCVTWGMFCRYDTTTARYTCHAGVEP
jgi:hypothetical protein